MLTKDQFQEALKVIHELGLVVLRPDDETDTNGRTRGYALTPAQIVDVHLEGIVNDLNAQIEKETATLEAWRRSIEKLEVQKKFFLEVVDWEEEGIV